SLSLAKWGINFASLAKIVLSAARFDGVARRASCSAPGLEQVMPDKLTEDQWQARATAAAIAAARKLATEGAAINKNVPVGRLGDVEWGWIIAAILFTWISTRAEQAAVEELNTEQTIRMTGLDRNPWDAGAIAAILPELADIKVDWSKPLCEWPKESIVDF